MGSCGFSGEVIGADDAKLLDAATCSTSSDHLMLNFSVRCGFIAE